MADRFDSVTASHIILQLGCFLITEGSVDHKQWKQVARLGINSTAYSGLPQFPKENAPPFTLLVGFPYGIMSRGWIGIYPALRVTFLLLADFILPKFLMDSCVHLLDFAPWIST